MFDFFSDKPDEPLIPEVVHHGPNGKSLKKMTRQRVIQDFLDVYAEKDMGKAIIRAHMTSDPKAFFDVVKKFIPNQMSLDAGEMLNLTVIDSYGNSMQISTASGPDSRENPGSLGVEPVSAPDRDLTSPRDADQPQIVLTERFGATLQRSAASPAQPLAETVTRNTLKYDFTL